MPLQELLQIDVDAEGRVRRRRRSWSSASSPQHLKAPGHLLHPLGAENSNHDNHNEDGHAPLPPPPAAKLGSVASLSDDGDDEEVEEGEEDRDARDGRNGLEDSALFAPGTARARAQESEDEEDDLLSSVDVKGDLDVGYDSDTLRDIDDLLSPRGSALLDQHDEYEEEEDDDNDDESHINAAKGLPASSKRRISTLRGPADNLTDGGLSETEVKAENVTPGRRRRFDFASTASDDSTVDILNLINSSRQKRSERRRRGLERILTPESVSKHLRTRSDTDICGSAEKAARYKRPVNTKGWKPFGSREHPPRLSTLRKVVSSSRSLAAAAEASQKARAQRKRRQQLDDHDLLLDTDAAPVGKSPRVPRAQPASSTKTSDTSRETRPAARPAWSALDVMRWALVLALWAVAIINPHAIVDFSRMLTGSTPSPPAGPRVPPAPPVEPLVVPPAAAGRVSLEANAQHRADHQQENTEVDEVPSSAKKSQSQQQQQQQHRNIEPKPARFVMPTEPARVEFVFPTADGASVPQAGVTLRFKFFHLFPDQLPLHRNPRLCMRLSNGGDDTLLGCLPVKDDQMEVSLKSLSLGPTRVVATLVSEAKKLGRAARQMNVILTDPVPRGDDASAPASSKTTTTTTTTTDEDTQERCVTTCSRTCTMTYEV